MTHPALIERITRSLAYMLRHQPEEFDLEVDEFGFAEMEDVVRALNERLGESVDDEDVHTAVTAGDRQRYEIEGSRIRALYGHSIDVQPGEPSKPPQELFVGVSRGDADRAQRYGLRAGRRRFLHLALTPEDAIESGRRAAHDYAIITVHSVDAWEEGINFYDRKSLFLSDPIPTDFLDVGEMRTDGFGEEDGGHGGHGRQGGHGREGRGDDRGRGGQRGGRGRGQGAARGSFGGAPQEPAYAARANEYVEETAHAHEEPAGDQPEFAAEASSHEGAAPSMEREGGMQGGEPRGGRRGRRGRRGGGGQPFRGGEQGFRGGEQGLQGGGEAPRESSAPAYGGRPTEESSFAPRGERPAARGAQGDIGGGRSFERGPANRPDDRPRRDDGPRHEGRREDAPRYEPRREDAPRQEAPRQEFRRDEAPRGEQRRDEAPRGEFRRDEAPRGDFRREQAPRRDDAPRGDFRRDEAPRGEPRRDEGPRHAPRHEEARRDEPRRDEPRRDEPRRDEPRRDEPRRDEPRRDEPRRDEPRREGWREGGSRGGPPPRHEDRPQHAAPRGDDDRGQRAPDRGMREDRRPQREPERSVREPDRSAREGEAGGSFGGGLTDAERAPREPRRPAPPPREKPVAREPDRTPPPRRDADSGGGFGAGV